MVGRVKVAGVLPPESERSSRWLQGGYTLPPESDRSSPASRSSSCDASRPCAEKCSKLTKTAGCLSARSGLCSVRGNLVGAARLHRLQGRGLAHMFLFGNRP